MYLLPTLEPRFRPIHFKTVSEMVKNKIPKMFLNALEGSASTSDSDTEMADLTTKTIDANDEDTIKREKLIFLTYLSSLSVYTGCSAQLHVIEFMPVFAHYANDTKDEELRTQCSILMMHVMSVIPVEKRNLPSFLQIIGECLNRCSWWKSRVTLLRFVQVSVFANIYLMSDHVRNICELLFLSLRDPQLEVRLASSDTLSGFINCGYIPVDQELMNVIYTLTQSQDHLEKHAGVLGLSAIILAYPYTIPPFIPELLVKFCRFSSEKQPISGTIKKTLGEFKRTHQDSWHEHKQEFTDDQLEVLVGVLVSANYYV